MEIRLQFIGTQHWNPETYDRVQELLKRFNPDVVGYEEELETIIELELYGP